VGTELVVGCPALSVWRVSDQQVLAVVLHGNASAGRDDELHELEKRLIPWVRVRRNHRSLSCKVVDLTFLR
jgi:hypothetical protein